MKLCRKCGNKFDSTGLKCGVCGFEPPEIEGFFQLGDSLVNNDAPFSVEDFEKLFTVEGSNFWFRARNRLILWAIAKYALQGNKFLEIGCGTGYVLHGISERFPTMQVSGSDIYSKGLAFASTRVSRAELFQMDATDIPFVDEFNLIGAFDVLEHIREDEKALCEIWKSLIPGGSLFVTVPQHPFLWSAADVHAHHVRRYTRKELHSKMERVGFKVLLITSFVSLPFPLMAISRFMNKKADADYDPAAELNMTKSVNSMLENILRFEQIFIKAGFSFPFGGSLLAIGKKI